MDVVRSHVTNGMVDATARSLAAPDHELVSAERLDISSSACVSSRIANASHPAAACSMGAGPAPSMSREVLTSGGTACQSIVGIAAIATIICWARFQLTELM